MKRLPFFPSFDARIQAQSELWRRHSMLSEKEKEETKPFITISREFGCPAYPLAEMLSKRLNEKFSESYVVYDKKLLEWISREKDVSEDLIKSLTEKTRSEVEDYLVGLISGEQSEMKTFRNLAKSIKAIAQKGNAVIVGRGGAIITSDMKSAFHVRLIAPLSWRLNNIRESYPDRVDLATKEAFMSIDKSRETFARKYLNSDLALAENYHLVLNTSKLTLGKQTDIIVNAMFGDK